MNPDDRKEKIDDLLSKIVTLQSNPHYRMADVVYRRGLRFKDSTEQVMALAEFEGTILRNYISATTDIETPNIALLSSLVDRAIDSGRFLLPRADELVVHIRAGDVVQLDWFLQGDFVEKIGQFDIQKCKLVVCFAFQEYFARGWWLFSEEKLRKNQDMMRQFLDDLLGKHENMEFDVVSNREVDRDFVYMVASSHFIRDVGGFSELIEEMRAFRAQRRQPS